MRKCAEMENGRKRDVMEWWLQLRDGQGGKKGTSD